MKTLPEIRVEIDRIDQEIMRLFLERMNCARQVAEIKDAQNLPIFVPAREEEILQKRAAQAGQFDKKANVLYGTLMDLSRAYQYELLNTRPALYDLLLSANRSPLPTSGTVVCQGIEGAYSHQAALRFFPDGEYTFRPKFEDVFLALQNGEAEFGVLPLENSAAGSVSEVYDLLIKYRYFIINELSLPVSHCLCALPGTDEASIRTVCSHPQALAQCAGMIVHHSFQQEVCSNTAVAAQTVAQRGDPTVGALCSPLAAQKAGLQILRENVQDSASNQTRFVVISRQLHITQNADQITICFSLPHKAGSLHRTLTQISAAGLSLNKIESRPNPDSPFEYRFCLELSGNVALEETANLLCALASETLDFALIGNHPVLE